MEQLKRYRVKTLSISGLYGKIYRNGDEIISSQIKPEQLPVLLQQDALEEITSAAKDDNDTPPSGEAKQVPPIIGDDEPLSGQQKKIKELEDALAAAIQTGVKSKITKAQKALDKAKETGGDA